MDFTSFLRDKILNHVFRNTTYTPPATVFVALYTDVGASVECVGTGYARQAIAFGAPSGHVVSNTGLIDFGAAGAGDWGTIRAVALCDAVSAGNQLATKQIASPLVVNSGDHVQLPIGNNTVAL